MGELVLAWYCFGACLLVGSDRQERKEYEDDKKGMIEGRGVRMSALHFVAKERA
jgi:hypothetical protein